MQRVIFKSMINGDYTESIPPSRPDPDNERLHQKRSQLIAALRIKTMSWGVVQGQVAKRLCVSRPYINMVLNGSRGASIDKLIELAELSGLVVTLLIEDTGSIGNQSIVKGLGDSE